MTPLLRGALAVYPIGQLLARVRERMKGPRAEAWAPVLGTLSRMAEVALCREVAVACAESSVRGLCAKARHLWPPQDDLEAVPSARLLATLELAEVSLEEIAETVRARMARATSELLELRRRARTNLALGLGGTVAVNAGDLVYLSTELLELFGEPTRPEVPRG